MSSELTPLAQRAKESSLKLLHEIATKNSKTTFFRESPHLLALREALDGAIAEDVDSLYNTFKANVSFSTYSEYSPFIKRLTEPEGGVCDEDSVRDLLSPGLPLFIARTSGTSSPTFKLFPKYPHIQYSTAFGPRPGESEPCTNSFVVGASVFTHVPVKRSDGTSYQIPSSTVASGIIRVRFGVISLEEDEAASTYEPSSGCPMAVSFVPGHEPFLLTKFFFMLMHPTIKFITATFTTLLYDGVAYMERNWDMLVDGIESGVVPPSINLGQYGDIIGKSVQPNPERARQLRRIKQGSCGWLKEIWPDLKRVVLAASGVYALPFKKLQHHFGPEVTFCSTGIICSEAVIASGVPSDPTNMTVFQVQNFEFIEFLDVEDPEEPSKLKGVWELEIGKRYELFITTQDGLWRYRQGDVLEIVDFDPENGYPHVRFVERRGAKFRVCFECIGEDELMKAIAAATQVLGSDVLEFTTTPDLVHHRGYNFIVELANGDQPSDWQQFHATLKDAAARIDAILRENIPYNSGRDSNIIFPPVIRVAQKGTFAAYRAMRVERESVSVGQMKVPMGIVDIDTIRWFEARVVANSTESRL